MKYADINRRYTEIVAEYMAKGYAINTATMRGSQGETAKIDLTNGTEIIRILIDTFSDWERNTEGVQIIVGRNTDDIRANDSDRCGIVWSNHLEIISTERFYQLGADYRHGYYYSPDEEKAIACRKLHYARCKARGQYDRGADEDITDKHLDLAKRIAQIHLGATRIRRCDLRLTKQPRKGEATTYTVRYCQKTYRLK